MTLINQNRTIYIAIALFSLICVRILNVFQLFWSSEGKALLSGLSMGQVAINLK